MTRKRDDAPPVGPDEQAVIRALDQAARLEREIVAAARGPSSPRDQRVVESALQRAWRPDPARRLRPWLIAAGVALAAFGTWRWLAREELRDRPPEVTLGAHELRVLAPAGAVDDFTVLRWSSSSAGAPRYAVRVFDQATNTPLLEERDLRGFELALDNRDTRAWQDVRIEVEELDSAEQPVKSGRARAWRRSP